MWIFSKKSDLIFIFFPIIFGMLLTYSFHLSETTSLILLFIATLFDLSHVFSTYAITLDNPNESKEFYKKSFFYIIGLLSVWYFFELYYFWTFFIYITIYHNFKQGFGIFRWYEKRIDVYYKISSYLFKILCILPVIGFHFRNNVNLNFYSEQDSLLKYSGQPFEFNFLNTQFHFDNIFLFLVILLIILLFTFFLLNEIIILIKNKKNIIKLSYMLLFILMYNISFLFGKNLVQVAFTIIIIHAIAYLKILHHYSPQIRSQNRNEFYMKNVAIIVLGVSATIFIEFFVYDSLFSQNNGIIKYVITTIYVIPTLLHFLWDSVIWKNKHKNSSILYK